MYLTSAMQRYSYVRVGKVGKIRYSYLDLLILRRVAVRRVIQTRIKGSVSHTITYKVQLSFDIPISFI